VSQQRNESGLEEKDLVLIGFSQGTMMALETAYKHEQPNAGIIGFSGRLLFPDQFGIELRSKPPVILIHGEVDDVVPVNDSIEANKLFRDLGIDTQFHLSPNAGHTIAPDGLEAALEFYKDKILK